MGRFLAKAEVSGDIAGSLKELGVSIVDYSRAGHSDSTFRAACTNLDMAIREAVVTNLTAKAAEGNVRAAALLEKSLGLVQPSDDRMPWPSAMPAWIRHELTKTYLTAIGEAMPDFEPPCCRFCHAKGRLDADPQIRYRSGWVVYLPRGAKEVEALELPREV